MADDKLPAEIESNPDFGRSFEIDKSQLPVGKEAFNNVIYNSNENCAQGNRVYCINRDGSHAYNVTLQVVSFGPGGGTFQTVKRNEAGGTMFLSCSRQGSWSYTWSVIGEVRL